MNVNPSHDDQPDGCMNCQKARPIVMIEFTERYHGLVQILHLCANCCNLLEVNLCILRKRIDAKNSSEKHLAALAAREQQR